MLTALWQAFSVELKIAEITSFGAFYSTALATFKSEATEKYCIVRLTSFSWLNFRLKFDLKCSIKMF